ncbi:MAG: ribonuclease III domain-containing protein, partial [Bacillota bacterium]
MSDRLGTALLAYIGDAVFGLFVRTLALDRLCRTPGAAPPRVETVHREVEQVVTAEGQARVLGALLPVLTEEEQDVVRRARNARVRHRPRGSNYRAYRRSTGLEALV